jgi:hypothetical protein
VNAHHCTKVGVLRFVPAQNDRDVQLLVRDGDQADAFGFGHAAVLALVAPVDPYPVE